MPLMLREAFLNLRFKNRQATKAHDDINPFTRSQRAKFEREEKRKMGEEKRKKEEERWREGWSEDVWEKLRPLLGRRRCHVVVSRKMEKKKRKCNYHIAPVGPSPRRPGSRASSTCRQKI
jgi:hypothetical protein